MIIGLVGFIGSGKNTVADYLETEYGFKQMSFAESVKDALSVIFGWDREMLEGNTPESRRWRNEVDSWWSERLGIGNFTPRWAMQNFATDLCRNEFHDEIWVASLQNKLRYVSDNIVISDCRFRNEIQMINDIGGNIVRVKRGSDPEWFDTAIMANSGNAICRQRLNSLGVHNSETDWIGCQIRRVINNELTIADLHRSVSDFIGEMAIFNQTK